MLYLTKVKPLYCTKTHCFLYCYCSQSAIKLPVQYPLSRVYLREQTLIWYNLVSTKELAEQTPFELWKFTRNVSSEVYLLSLLFGIHSLLEVFINLL